MRVYIDPFSETREPLWSTTIKPEFSQQTLNLFQQLSNASWGWQALPEKHWKHWTADYIDYFGIRQSKPENALFYVDGVNRSDTNSNSRKIESGKERAA